MRSLLLAAAALGLAAIPGAASADSLGRPCTDKPESQYLSLEALKAKAVEQGYQIRSGEIRKACAELYALDKNGKRAELFLDPTTGEIVAGDGQGETVMTGERDDDKHVATGAAADRDGDDKDGDD
jgi:hypothetical protein